MRLAIVVLAWTATSKISETPIEDTWAFLFVLTMLLAVFEDFKAILRD